LAARGELRGHAVEVVGERLHAEVNGAAGAAARGRNLPHDLFGLPRGLRGLGRRILPHP